MELQKYNAKDLLKNINKDKNGNLSLTDLFNDFSEKKKNTEPSAWLRQDNVKLLIETLADGLNMASNHIIKTKRGKGGGSYAHKSIFLAYAKYLDPNLHLLVNEIFFERVAEEINPDLAIDRGIKNYEKQGKSAQWITKRLQSKGIRNQFTSLLREHGVVGSGYKDCTDAMYIGLYGKPAKKIREAMNLPSKANVRELMSTVELSAISLAESLAMEDIENNRLFGNEECSLSSHLASREVSKSIINFRNK